MEASSGSIDLSLFKLWSTAEVDGMNFYIEIEKISKTNLARKIIENQVLHWTKIERDGHLI